MERVETSGGLPAAESIADHVSAPLAARRRGTRAFGRFVLHGGLLAATAVTTAIMGTLLSLPIPEDAGSAEALVGAIESLATNASPVASGLAFSFTLLTILGMHELGHYVACRYYGIEATPPYFIPAPPPILIGTFGAFIKIKSPFTSRRALFDVGVAGPIAGFVFALPAAVVGLLFATPAEPLTVEGAIVLNDPLLFVLLQRSLDLPPVINWNPIHFAAWVGLFATGLNLIPVGQLDGGHAVYALFGDRGHRLASRVLFLGVVALAGVALVAYGSASWLVFVVLLALLAFRPHPSPMVAEDDIGLGRKLVALLTLVIFLLSFIPIPVTFT
jgi:membrane-associated protease RseP (regulator of RpoE activity)